MHKSFFVIIVALLGTPSLARAENAEGFSANRFEPAARGSDWFMADSLDFRGRFKPVFGTTLDESYRSLVLYTPDGAPDYSVVKDRFDVHLGGSVVFLDRFRADVSLPLALVNRGIAGSHKGVSYREPYRSPVQGDLRVGADVSILGRHGDLFQLAAGMRFWAPTGDPYSYSGDADIRWSPHVQAAGAYRAFYYAVNARYMYRGKKAAFGNATVGNEFGMTLAAGAKWLNERLFVGPEFTLSTRASDLAFTTKTTPAELVLGAHYTVGDTLRVGVGGGVGFTESPGDPVFRMLAGLDYSPFAGAVSKHPKATELDRDHDGVPDNADQCPLLAGHPSQFPGVYGCPDEDGDGVADAIDACPKQAGAPGAEPAGCADSDGDRIADAVDACPAVQGVKNANPHVHGCPAVEDIDGDGVEDSVDSCPDKPGPKREGKGSGCPDRDEDGIPDPQDACPDAVGVESKDPGAHGCPLAVLKQEEISISYQVRFKLASAELEGSADDLRLLAAVAAILNERPELKVRIEGHSDNVGNAARNVALSAQRANAVMRWLITNGIQATRLNAKGFGPAAPRASNETEEGRQMNRRVEFRIVK